MGHKNRNSEHMFFDYPINANGYDGAHLLNLAIHRLTNPYNKAMRADITVIDKDGDLQRTFIDLDNAKKRITMTELNLDKDHPQFDMVREDVFSQPLRKSRDVEDILSIASTGR